MEKEENRFNELELIMNSIIIAIILLIIAIFFWPNSDKKTQSNKIDNTKTQIKIIVKRVNIRKEATTNSEDIGDVYEGEVYTVLEHIDKSDFYWYKITTNTGITGYIASDPKAEYVKIISGVIDRTPPVISYNKDFLLFVNGEVVYDEVECTDNYTSCTLSYDKTDSRYIKFIAKDEDGNESFKEIRYYNIYDMGNKYLENNKYIDAIFEQEKIEDGFLIKATYKLKKLILNENKSVNYVPSITLFDESFNEIKLVTTKYNNYPIEDSCINNLDMSLKEEYFNKDLKENDSICINYYFDSQDTRIKYFALGFSGVENYTKDENYLANYYSKYYIK